MSSRRAPLVLSVAAMWAATAVAAREASACAPAHVAPTQPSLADPWRRALDDLIASSTEEGQPWSCSDAEIALLPDGDDGAMLRLHDARGRDVERRVARPDLVVATGEALLAQPGLPPARAGEPRLSANASSPASVTWIAPQRPGADAVADAETRLTADVLGGSRYGGPARAVWGTGTVRVAVLWGPWATGVWLRYAMPYMLDRVPRDFSESEASIGCSVGRTLVRSSTAVRANLAPSVALVSMEGGLEPSHASGALVDPRLGANIEAVIPWTHRFRGILSLEGELSPIGVVRQRQIDPALPPISAWGLGLGVGIEAAVR